VTYVIEQIAIKSFKSFKDVSLKLGPMNLFIGANASGKSNFFDALRVLQGIGYGFTLSEILDGKPKSATSEVWEGIRGGRGGTAFAYGGGEQPTVFQIGTGDRFSFEIAFSAMDGQLCNERLRGVYDSFSVDNQRSDSLLRAHCCAPGQGHPALLTFERNRLWRYRGDDEGEWA
jgi:energy-coupling factor transporter ATP-binding protein EcfA2